MATHSLDPKAAAGEAAAPHHVGHRQRLRERFLTAGPEGFHDYELLELLLFAAIPRVDVKPLAKRLIQRFGGLWGVLNASTADLKGVGLGEGALVTLQVAGAAALRGMREGTRGRTPLSSWQQVVDYCRASMAHLATEEVRLLFLDKRNGLIADEVHQWGTVDHTPLYPREVVKRALELAASALILVHNHPSGDPTPSRADIEMTRQIVKAASTLGIAIHDHLIIGRDGVASFKSMGLL